MSRRGARPSTPRHKSLNPPAHIPQPCSSIGVSVAEAQLFPASFSADSTPNDSQDISPTHLLSGDDCVVSCLVSSASLEDLLNQWSASACECSKKRWFLADIRPIELFRLYVSRPVYCLWWKSASTHHMAQRVTAQTP